MVMLSKIYLKLVQTTGIQVISSHNTDICPGFHGTARATLDDISELFRAMWDKGFGIEN